MLAGMAAATPVRRRPSERRAPTLRAAGARQARMARAATGAWTRKMARHHEQLGQHATRAGPVTAPTPAAALHQDRAHVIEPRPAPSTGSEPASRSVAPMPWKARAVSRNGRLEARPAAQDASSEQAEANAGEHGRADPPM